MEFDRRSLCAGSIAALAFAGNSTPVRADAPTDDYLVIVFAAPTTPDQATAFDDWYENEHIPDMLSLPGYLRARRLVVEARGTPISNLPTNITVYDVRVSDMDASIAEVQRRKAQGGIRESPAFDSAQSVALVYHALGPTRWAGANTPPPDVRPDERLKHFSLFGMANPARGMDTEFNDWYDKVHLDEVLSAPGFISARRYRLYRSLKKGYLPPEYLAEFEFDAAEVDRTRDLLAERRRTGATHSSQAWSMDGYQEYWALNRTVRMRPS